MSKNYLNEDLPERESRQLINEFEKMLLTNSVHFFDQETYEYMIDYYEAGFDFYKAEVVVDWAVELHPFSSFFIIKKARLQIDAHKNTAALELLSKAQALSPAELEIFVLQAEAYINIQNYMAALDCLRQAMLYANETEKADIFLAVADVYDACEKEGKSYLFIKKALKLAPTHEGALSRINYYIELFSKQTESISIHKTIIDHDPYCDLAWYNLGSAYTGLGLHKKAIEAYEFVTAINDNYDLAYMGIGNAYFALENFAKAKDNYLMALEIGDPDEDLYYMLGQVCKRMANHTEALCYFEKLIDTSTHNAHYYAETADCLTQLHNWKKAIVALKQALQLEPNFQPYLSKMAFCFEKLGDIDNAIACYNTLIDQCPNEIFYWTNLIALYFYEQNYQAALDCIANAKQHLGNHVVLCYQQAASLYAAGQKTEALVWFNYALETDEQLSPLFFDMLPHLENNKLFSTLL
jgi:tetratricopeptide (TPR) repeat protein